MFEIKGKIGGKTYTLRYNHADCDGEMVDGKWIIKNLDDYVISGDEAAIKKLFDESKKDHGYLGLCPGGVEFKQGYLKYELASYSLAINYVFDSIISSKDDHELFDPNVIY